MQIIADPKYYAEKEQLYFDVRNKEGRIVTDSELAILPVASAENPHKKEWDIRLRNFQRLQRYLNQHPKPLKIMDIGCGNGWMANQLHQSGHIITAVDLNMSELLQAERVFGESDTLHWVYADILNDIVPFANYDIILLAASCQYFNNLNLLTKKLLSLTKSKGEIHLFDSMFYKSNEIVNAANRSTDYYTTLGFSAMGKYYFHHSVETLKSSGYKKIYPGIFSASTLQWWKLTKV